MTFSTTERQHPASPPHAPRRQGKHCRIKWPKEVPPRQPIATVAIPNEPPKHVHDATPNVSKSCTSTGSQSPANNQRTHILRELFYRWLGLVVFIWSTMLIIFWLSDFISLLFLVISLSRPFCALSILMWYDTTVNTVTQRVNGAEPWLLASRWVSIPYLCSVPHNQPNVPTKNVSAPTIPK